MAAAASTRKPLSLHPACKANARANAAYPWPASIPAPTRREIADMIEGLIAYLDACDGDADCEREEADQSTMEWVGTGAQRFNVGLAA